MKVLLVGGGGREHAVAWKLKKDNPDIEIYAAPGNGGIQTLAECAPIRANDIPALKAFVYSHDIDFTVVGPEEPLVKGIADEFGSLPVFGPRAKGAMLEGSKSYAKAFMKKYGIPTAAYEVFSDYGEAISYACRTGAPLVIKADGLAAGKGVTVCRTLDEAEAALAETLRDGRFGDAGRVAVIEELLQGPEVSVLAFTDGQTILPMASAQDHKRAYDGDRGPNTGGMGAFSPSPHYTEEIRKMTEARIIYPTLDALIKEGIDYKGVLYFGLMITAGGPKVIEYNCRFGDPETQTVLTRLDNNLLEIMQACVSGTLDKVCLKWREEAAVCVAMVSGGYPGAYQKGVPINGLNNVIETDRLVVFHAGDMLEDGVLLTDGGRVLGVTALAESVGMAAESAYGAVNEISFDGVRFRKDIGRTF